MLRYLVLLAAFSAYVSEALDAMEGNAMAVPGVDWRAIRAQAMEEARAASTQTEAHAIVRRAIAALDDGHSFLLRPDEASALKTTDAPPDRAAVEGRVARIALHGFTGTNREAMHRYVRTLREDMKSAQASGACGFVVDLRKNTGGNMWPQLLALQPLLGTGRVGAFHTPTETDAWTIDANEARAGEAVALRITTPLPAPDLAAMPVAVLLAPETTSAGEAVAIAFAGRDRTRSFGWHTRGATTANLGIMLSDGAMMMVASSLMLDREGRAHRPYVRPNEQTNAEGRVRGIDVTLDAATAWLHDMQGC